MAIEKKFGGERLGTGAGHKVYLKEYERSNFNMQEVFRTTANVGTIIPAKVLVGKNGDTFDIDIETAVRTQPALTQLYGRFKLQVDVFEVPMRLYLSVLHNNKFGIGMKMSQVRFPEMLFDGRNINASSLGDSELDAHLRQVSSDSLSFYLGMKGAKSTSGTTLKFYHNAIFHLGYWDIVKNYYANKQEKKGYYIGKTSKSVFDVNWLITDSTETLLRGSGVWGETVGGTGNINSTTIGFTENTDIIELKCPLDRKLEFENWRCEGKITGDIDAKVYSAIGIANSIGATQFVSSSESGGYYRVKFRFTNKPTKTFSYEATRTIIGTGPSARNNIDIKEYDLEKFDELREMILAYRTMNASYKIPLTGTGAFPPMVDEQQNDGAGNSKRWYSQSGLALKTYLSDRFNNWLDSTLHEGASGIAELTSVAVVNNKINLETFNLSKKLYNMFQQVAVSGNTYEDWQEAVFGEEALRRIETPMYCGGLSSEVYFDEILNSGNDGNRPLGDVAGVGREGNVKGGKITVKCKEPSIIYVLMSLTPRLSYSQGNDWIFDLSSIDDIHKPALDGVKYGDLLEDSMYYADANLATGTSSSYHTRTRYSRGKVPAYIDYQTGYDRNAGDFADSKKLGFMVLDRNYSIDRATNKITDKTTYIDPRKFNYVFADNKLSSQNFWVQLNLKIDARRKMSAKIIPNL